MEAVPFHHRGSLGALAGSGRPEEHIVFHFRIPGIQDIDILEIASHFIVIQPVTNNEGVGDGQADIVELDILGIGLRLEQQGADLDLLRLVLFELFSQCDDGVAGIDDILDHDDAASGDIARETHHLLHLSGRRRPGIGGQFDGHQLAGEIEPLHQGGSKHHRTVQHAEDDGDVGAAGIVRIDPGGHFIDGLFNLGIGDEKLESLVEKSDLIHGYLTMCLQI